MGCWRTPPCTYLLASGYWAEVWCPDEQTRALRRFGEDVYEGMIVGDNSRADDLDVNATKQKHQTNVRGAAADVLVRLVPAKRPSLDQALEFLREDECVEITPNAVRLRKAALGKAERRKAARRAKATAAA